MTMVSRATRDQMAGMLADAASMLHELLPPTRLSGAVSEQDHWLMVATRPRLKELSRSVVSLATRVRAERAEWMVDMNACHWQKHDWLDWAVLTDRDWSLSLRIAAKHDRAHGIVYVLDVLVR